jgi:nucleotide-binding universal stress UspA family protein
MASKLKKILVPLDGSKNSLRGLKFAINLAKQSNMQIIVLTIFSLPFYLKTQNVIEQKRKKSEQIINHAKNITQKDKVSFFGEIKFSDNIGQEIILYSEKNKIDMIIIGSRGPDPEIELFLGSVANYVINKSKIPVTVIK